MSKKHESKKVRIESRSEREGVNAHYITPNYSRMVYKPLPVAFILREGERERKADTERLRGRERERQIQKDSEGEKKEGRKNAWTTRVPWRIALSLSLLCEELT